VGEVLGNSSLRSPLGSKWRQPRMVSRYPALASSPALHLLSSEEGVCSQSCVPYLVLKDSLTLTPQIWTEDL
jgi:hypothetical protein